VPEAASADAAARRPQPLGGRVQPRSLAAVFWAGAVLGRLAGALVRARGTDGSSSGGLERGCRVSAAACECSGTALTQALLRARGRAQCAARTMQPAYPSRRGGQCLALEPCRAAQVRRLLPAIMLRRVEVFRLRS